MRKTVLFAVAALTAGTVLAAPATSRRSGVSLARGQQAADAAAGASEASLKGIFTDGDFRRVVSESGSGDALGDSVSTHMTASPMFVRNDVYASELLKIFERRRIDDLPVCDAQGHVVGLVDIQDLPKMKVL